ncbi:MAG: hypothetical protein KF752_08665 [Pirellulaceae bacterium]|nr:hypothetical protein [Pirellulaceae bacterium]
MLVCVACVGLNPIRPALAQTLEACDFTSSHTRLHVLEPTPVDAAYSFGACL